jgi:hypothetical protein
MLDQCVEYYVGELETVSGSRSLFLQVHEIASSIIAATTASRVGSRLQTQCFSLVLLYRLDILSDSASKKMTARIT